MPESTKRPIDVEHLVQWAAAELTKKRQAGQARGLDPLPVSREDATLLGKWLRPAGFPTISPMFKQGFAPRASSSRGGAVDPDALIIEEKIGDLGKRLAGLGAPEELALDFGFAVDIAAPFLGALRNIANLVIVHGRLCSRPAIGVDMPRPSPRLAPNGKPGVWRLQRVVDPTFGGGFAEMDIESPAPAIKKGNYPAGAYGALIWEPDPQLIINDRAEYLAWRLALDELAAMLSDELELFTVFAAAAAPMPWRGDVDGDPFPDLFRPGIERIYNAREVAAIEARRAARERRARTMVRRHAPTPRAAGARDALGGES